MKKRNLMALLLALILSLSLLTGCGGQTAAVTEGAALGSGGVLVLSVNPEIAVEYDEKGVVTGVTARNDDALAIINSCEGLIGRHTREAVTDLVSAIGEAGYFLEEVEGGHRRITLEIEAGSKLPHEAFLDEVVEEIRNCVNKNNWTAPLQVENESDYGITDYVDTDYGPDNDGVTDFGSTDYDDTDYGPNNDGVTDFGSTDYDDTDYGPNNDGVTDFGSTDYDDTDYGPNNDGVTDFGSTDYDDTDYGPNNDGVTDFGSTDYDDTDYGPNNDGVTDFGVSDYDDTDYDDTDYDGTDYGSSVYGDSAYD